MTLKKWEFPPQTKRKEEVTITRARIGHTYLTHAHLISKDLAPLCNVCNINLSIEQIMICPKYSEARQILNNPQSNQEVLKEENATVIYTFFKTIKLSEKL